jgi:two-component system response regulator CpxR
MAVHTLLLLDDDRELCALLTDYLKPEGFEILTAHDGNTGLAAALNFPSLDLILLDVMLPGKNGFDVLRELRAHSGVPVLMLTAKGDEVDRIVGLELGADDYLPKPFNPRELLARIRAILRRKESPAAPNTLERLVSGDIELDPSRRTISVGGTDIDLTSVEFKLLEALLRTPGKVVSRDALSRAALDRPLSPFERSLDVHMSNLRKKLGPGPDGSPRIRTLRSEGYLLSCEATR